MKSSIPIFLIFSLALILWFVPFVWPIGMAVDPGEIDISDVPLGKKVAVSQLGGEDMKLKIINKSEVTYYYTIDILSSHEAAAPLKNGYEDINDISWIFPKSKEVRVKAGDAESVELYISIPEKKEYSGRKYQAVVEVKSKKNRPGETFVLACQILMLFSTETGD